MKVGEAEEEGTVRSNITQIDDIIIALNKEKNDNTKGIEKFALEICTQLDELKEKLGKVLAKKIEHDRQYEYKLQNLKDKLEEANVNFMTKRFLLLEGRKKSSK